MLGNVREWCLDSIHNYPDLDSIRNYPDPIEVYNNPDFGKVLSDTTTNFSKVRSARGVRGGSWASESYQLQGSYSSRIPVTNNAILGFRCVRPIKP